MRTKNKQFLLMATGLVLSATASAYDFESGGIYYNILDGTTKVEVTYDGRDQMYEQCYTNSEYVIPESVEYNGTTYTVTRIGDGAFVYAGSVQSITLPSTLESIGSQPFTYTSLESIVFTGEKAPQLAASNSLGKDWDMYPSIYVPDAYVGDYSYSTINENEYNTWNYYYSIQGISQKPFILEGVKYGNFNEESRECAVVGCKNSWMYPRQIPETVLKDEVTYTVTSIEGINYSSSLFIPRTVRAVNWMSIGTPETTSITVDEDNPYFQSLSDGHYVVQFDEYGGKKLVWSYGAETIPEGVTAIAQYSLWVAPGTKTLTIPSSVALVSDYAFNSAGELRKVYCHVENPSNFSWYAFSGLMSNVTVYVSDVDAYTNKFNGYTDAQFKSLDYVPVEIDGLEYEITSKEAKTVAVTGCTYTKSFAYMEDGVEIPETVTIGDVDYTVTSIADNAFYDNWMNTAIIPASIETIGNGAFYCQGNSYWNVTCLGSVPPTIQDNTFYKDWYSSSINGTLYVSAEAVETYRAASNWMDFSSIQSMDSQPISAMIDNIMYDVIDKEAKTCAISSYMGSSNKVTIPATVTINDVEYTVTKIQNWTFNNTNPNTFIFESSTPVELEYNEYTENVGRDEYDEYGNYLGWFDGEVTYRGSYALGSNVSSIFVPADAVDAYKTAWRDYKNYNANGYEYARYVKSADEIITNYDLVDGVIYSNNNQFYDVDITYTRNFSTTAWQALYVPFSLSVDEWNAAGLQIAQINNVHQYDMDEDGSIDKTMLEAFVKKNGRTKPNTPYLVKADAEGEVTVSTTGTLYPSEQNNIYCSSMSTEYYFYGTYEGVNDMYFNSYYAFDLEGNLCQASRPGVSLGGFRWYVSTSNRGTYDDYGYYANARAISISVDGEIVSDATAIATVSNESVSNSKAVYSLDGRLVSEDGNTTSLRAGVYIQNGKKFLKK